MGWASAMTPHSFEYLKLFPPAIIVAITKLFMFKKLLIVIPVLIIAIVAFVGIVSELPAITRFVSGKSYQNTAPEKQIDVNTVVPKGTILMDTLTQVSPDKHYTAFITAKTKGLVDSTIWVTDNSGNLTKIDFQSGQYTFYSAIAWNKDSTKFAYLKLYPTEIIVVDLTNDFYRERIITKTDTKDNNLLNPSIGYEGKSYLKWDDDDKIEFDDNISIPAKRYTIDYNTREVAFKNNIEDTNATYADVKDSGTAFFSQRDPSWNKNQLGKCANQTIGSAGCAIASISMVFKELGVSDINPYKLNNELSTDNYQGYANDCDVSWYIAASYYKNIVFKGAYGSSFERLDYELAQGNKVILGFDKVPYTNVPHWVVVGKKVGNTYYISDPWGYSQDLNRTLDDLGGKFDHMIVYKKAG